jgi:hypothetical protein
MNTQTAAPPSTEAFQQLEAALLAYLDALTGKERLDRVTDLLHRLAFEERLDRVTDLLHRLAFEERLAALTPEQLASMNDLMLHPALREVDPEAVVTDTVKLMKAVFKEQTEAYAAYVEANREFDQMTDKEREEEDQYGDTPEPPAAVPTPGTLLFCMLADIAAMTALVMNGVEEKSSVVLEINGPKRIRSYGNSVPDYEHEQLHESVTQRVYPRDWVPGAAIRGLKISHTIR